MTAADCKAGSAAAGGGSCGDDVTLPVTAADCKTGSAVTAAAREAGAALPVIARLRRLCGGDGAFGDDVAVTAADCEAGSAAAGGGSCGGDVTLSSATGGVTAADCEAGSAAAGSPGSDTTVPGALVPRKATNGPVSATTPSAGRGAITCSSKPAINAVSRSSRARRLPTSRCCT